MTSPMPNPDAARLRMLTAAFLAVAMAATVGTALGFQYIGGYIPCKLCYEQRIPYYVGAPLMLLAAVAAAASPFRSMIATLAPSAANSAEAAPPIPVAPPEMMATLPASFPAIVDFLPLSPWRHRRRNTDAIAGLARGQARRVRPARTGAAWRGGRLSYPSGHM